MLSNQKYRKIFLLTVFILLMVFLLPHFALAAAGPDVGINYPAGTGLSNSSDIRVIIARIIRIIIGFLGVVALGLIIYAGWLWMTSEGNEEKVGEAKKLLTNAVIGLVIILASFGIASFILNSLLGESGGNVNIAGGGGGWSGGGIAALGSGIINSHYPERNQTGVPRNTSIVITFKEAMDPATLMNGNKANSQNIKIYPTKDGQASAVTFDIAAAKTADNKTFVFRPSQYLGSSSEKIWYSVALSKNIKKASGDSAFPGVVGDTAYDWMFEVGTFIDNTPPQIESVIPFPSSVEARNVVVQINFSEPVNPVAASGATGSFGNIKVIDSAAASLLNGTFYISNQYKTVEFLTNDSCGVNSCGNTVYCLPGNKLIKTLVSAATLMASGTPTAVLPYDGVVDLADNSLDGNGDGTAQGPMAQSKLPPYNANNQSPAGEGDDYTWSFNTNDTIDTTPPVVTSVSPQVNGSGVGLSTVPQAIFSKLLLSSSLNNSSVNFKSAGSNFNYWVFKSDNMTDKQTAVKVGHDQFNENNNYSLQLNSGVKDIYQNCYTPCSGLGTVGAPSCCNGQASNRNSCQ